MITVRPTRALRVAFARWAVAQTPKVRTCSTTDFAVRPHLFASLPEELLVGALVDGHRYVSPSEDETPEMLPGVPGEPLPPVPDSAYGPAAVPLEPVPDEAVAVNAVSAAEEEGGGRGDQTPDGPEGRPFPCGLCPRAFTTPRGRDSHRRQAHREA